MAKSPIKFGLGEYSDEPFELKSGNKPTFKNMGSSSPFDMSAKSWKKNQEMRDEEDAAMMGSPAYQNDDKKDDKKDDNGNGIGKGWQMLVQGLTSGLDAVYGTGKVEFEGGKVKKKEEKKETEEEKKLREEKERKDAAEKAVEKNTAQKIIDKDLSKNKTKKKA